MVKTVRNIYYNTCFTVKLFAYETPANMAHYVIFLKLAFHKCIVRLQFEN